MLFQYKGKPIGKGTQNNVGAILSMWCKCFSAVHKLAQLFQHGLKKSSSFASGSIVPQCWHNLLSQSITQPSWQGQIISKVIWSFEKGSYNACLVCFKTFGVFCHVLFRKWWLHLRVYMYHWGIAHEGLYTMDYSALKLSLNVCNKSLNYWNLAFSGKLELVVGFLRLLLG